MHEQRAAALLLALPDLAHEAAVGRARKTRAAAAVARRATGAIAAVEAVGTAVGIASAAEVTSPERWTQVALSLIFRSC